MARQQRDTHICSCGHEDDIHVRRTSRCKGTDSYGFACECVGFEHSDSCMDLDGTEEDQRPELRSDPEPHYRHLVEDNSQVDREEPE